METIGEYNKESAHSKFDKHLNSAQRVNDQLNLSLRNNEMNGTGETIKKIDKKKIKKHRRQGTHHHYHIDFNFEQVNNILVSYGGIGL